MSLATSPAILLRSHPYSESSRILRFLTPDHGIVALVGRGVRKGGSRGRGALDTFGRGTLVFTHRPDRDLHNLRDFTPEGASLGLGRDLRRFYGASIVAEILLLHALEEGDRALFDWVAEVFGRLGTAPDADVPGWIVSGAWRTLALLGFPPELERCVQCGGTLGVGDGEEMDRFDVSEGGLRCVRCATGGASMPRVGPRAREQLAFLVAGRPPHPLTHPASHLGLVEGFALHHLGARREFRSFPVLKDLLTRTGAADQDRM